MTQILTTRQAEELYVASPSSPLHHNEFAPGPSLMTMQAQVHNSLPLGKQPYKCGDGAAGGC